MNVLGVGAHFDDLELGCSGTLIKHVQKGDQVTMLVVSNSSYKYIDGRELRDSKTAYQEGLKASKIIGADLICLDYTTFHIPNDDSLTKTLMAHIENLKIDIIYSHWIYDLHRDHQHAGKSALMAGRHVPRFLMYRSNYYDSERPFIGNYYSDISAVMGKKIEVIKAHESELERVKYKWVDFVEKQNANEGQKNGTKHAECFEAVRYLMD